ncbi:hypothetical protein [Photobacterium sp. OFAV2-7]|uniref:hypothetical protein n=1 Tax=Photobacterium sp. OFAV2-7 TaxID=2917748 RepID=UPI001EF6289E|nr:hypothetical protein [Photobacterium sp. OFAV2-7]MCG7587847.1 hypothetical protein [Photobacterium sp. OFAV2-7]
MLEVVSDNEMTPAAFEAMYQKLLLTPYEAIVCDCGHCIFTHQGVIRSRCVKVAEGLALCRCKKWVRVPVGMAELH